MGSMFLSWSYLVSWCCSLVTKQSTLPFGRCLLQISGRIRACFFTVTFSIATGKWQDSITVILQLLDVQDSITVIPQLLDGQDSITVILQLLDRQDSITVIPQLLDVQDSITVIPQLLDVQDSITVIPQLLDGQDSITVTPQLLDGQDSITVIPQLLDGQDSITVIPQLLDGQDSMTVIPQLLPQICQSSYTSMLYSPLLTFYHVHKGLWLICFSFVHIESAPDWYNVWYWQVWKIHFLFLCEITVKTAGPCDRDIV